MPFSFNPCFRGTCSWWYCFSVYVLDYYQFQSLFSWNLLLMADDEIIGKTFLMFQSLFSWNLLLMFQETHQHLDMFGFNPCFRGTCSWWAKRTAARKKKEKGFNPCFRGTCSWCYERYYPFRSWLMFQSLFSWNLLLMNGSYVTIEVKDIGFNPCFRGTCSWWLQTFLTP